jgi:hypothetical protein
VTYLGWVKIFLVLATAGFLGLLAWGYARNHPEDLPWTKLDLGRPVGAFTGRKLAALAGDAEQCRALLRRAGISFTALPPRRAGQSCGYDDAVRFGPGGSLAMAYRPADLRTSCPVAAGLALWEWHVVQPAALRHLGVRTVAIDHFGSYSSRRRPPRQRRRRLEGARSERTLPPRRARRRLPPVRHHPVSGL